MRLGAHGARCFARSGEGEEGFECRHPAPGSARQINIIRADRRENDAALFGAGDQYIQPAFASIGGKRAEAHGKLAISAAPIADRNHDGIAFITLHVFEVFHKERFIRMGAEKRFSIRIVAPRRFNGVQNGIALADGKRRDTQRIARGFPSMGNDSFRHCARFFRIGAGAARIKPPFNAPQRQAQRG